MLTEKQITDLQVPFTLSEHGTFQKNPYILKSAIRARLNRVAPGWHLLPPELIAHDENVIVMRGGIQIGDIKRYAIGTGIVLRATSDGVVFDGAKLAGMIAKAYKQATSDILPRAAVEFGIGEYLKNKPKGINEDSFAGWLAKLTAPKFIGWTGDEVKTFIVHWEIESLTLDDLKKALNVKAGWNDWKGTLEQANIAVTKYIEDNLFNQKPAQPIAATGTPSSLRMIDCPVNLLEPGDIVYQSYKTSGSGPAETRYEVLENWGKVGNTFKLDLKNLTTGKVETVQWPGIDQTLCAGPKVRAYAADPAVCLPAKKGSKPVWNGQFAVTTR